MKKQKDLTSINTYLIVALVIVVAIGLYFTLSVPTVKKEAQITPPPREIALTLVGTDCKDCFNISIATDFIKQQSGINVTEINEITLEDSSETVEKYNLSRLPAILITGNITNLTIPNFDPREDALVFDNTPAPYYDVETKKIRGKVSVIQIEDPSCTECFNISQVVDQLEQAGVKIITRSTLDAKSEEGKQLIANYKIDKVPTLIFNKDALEYDVINQVWSQVGTEESDGKLVLRFVNPPYLNVSTGKTEGLVTLTYITDKSCAECYNVSALKTIFQQSFNMYVKAEETVDASSTKGKLLIKRYGLELVPIVVLSKDANAYPSLPDAWKTIGTQEKDGSFTLRNIQLLKNFFEQSGQPFSYKNITSGEILNATAETAGEEAEIEPPEVEES